MEEQRRYGLEQAMESDRTLEAFRDSVRNDSDICEWAKKIGYTGDRGALVDKYMTSCLEVMERNGDAESYINVGEIEQKILETVAREKLYALPYSDCCFLLKCSDLHYNIYDENQRFILEYLKLADKHKKKIKDYFEQGNITKLNLLTEIKEDEGKRQQVKLLLTIWEKMYDYCELPDSLEDKKQLIESLLPQKFCINLLDAIEIYPNIDEDELAMWMLYILMNAKAQNKVMRKIQEMGGQ